MGKAPSRGEGTADAARGDLRIEIVSRGFAGSLILEQTDFVFRHTATGTNRSSFLSILRGDTTIAPSHEIWPTIYSFLPFFLFFLSFFRGGLEFFEIESFEKRRGGGGLIFESNRTLSYRIVWCFTLPSFPPHCMVKSHYRGSRNLTWFLLLLRDRSPIIISTSITPLWQ